jgi:preprotein translocase subunit SecA
MRLFASERIAKVMDRLGFEEGERIESPLISKSIERAQKKVEENNFGIRKRLLEYDDVMNKQRTVIYERRRHALMGERIGMDITNLLWDRVTTILNNNDFAGCKEQYLKVFAMEIPFTEEEFSTLGKEQLEEKAFQTVMTEFKNRTERIHNMAWPVIKDIAENHGNEYQRIAIPITDGRLIYNMTFDLQELYKSEGKDIIKQFEKMIMLHTIDDNWKENLRQLDDLRHSVQNASYEQKDPLLIFKLESVKLWDNMINEMHDTISMTLTRARIHQQQPDVPMDMMHQAPAEEPKREQPKLTTQHDELQGDGSPVQDNERPQYNDPSARQQPRTPIIKDKMPRPNDPCPCGSGLKFKNCHGKNI